MEIYSSNMDNLRTLLGVGRTDPTNGEIRQTGHFPAAAQKGVGPDRATLSSAASEAAVMTGADGVQTEKVAAVQAALASGTYSVSPAAVASKLVDSMLGARR